jgi:hypothetical protein
LRASDEVIDSIRFNGPKAISNTYKFASPIPRRARKSVRGRNPCGGAMLYLSEATTVIMARITVPVNSAKKHEIFVK